MQSIRGGESREDAGRGEYREGLMGDLIRRLTLGHQTEKEMDNEIEATK